jgi:hypothetical protein
MMFRSDLMKKGALNVSLPSFCSNANESLYRKYEHMCVSNSTRNMQIQLTTIDMIASAISSATGAP